MKIFVYGTLKMGHGNNRLLKKSEFRGVAKTVKPLKFVSLGGFPAIILDDVDKELSIRNIVKGEVYEVEDITRIDQLEGYPTFYDRSEIETTEGTAWTYHLKDESYGDHSIVEGGTW